ncbi:hypothetical protein CMI38_00260 [Candidatus Pacearchaeota archaeon]|jgi:hypothetical protein|nr:hypothetical protein [Candidatus Pacearchaeota archaeon]|tara:strand:- start:179 stop:403 length:225 start_codon:yes stop_codon:yes gene_type:complete
MERKEIVRGARMCLADIVRMAELIKGINNGKYRNLSLGELRDRNNKLVVGDDGISARYVIGNEVYKIRVEREEK